MCNQQTDLPTPNLFAETYSPGSRCIEHGRQWFQTTSETNTTSAEYGGGCYKVWLTIKLTYSYLPVFYYTVKLTEGLLIPVATSVQVPLWGGDLCQICWTDHANIHAQYANMYAQNANIHVHHISNMSIAFIEPTMPTCMHIMPTFMHNMPTCMHNMPTFIHKMLIFMHNMPSSISTIYHDISVHISAIR